jgi:hypothetical protein
MFMNQICKYPKGRLYYSKFALYYTKQHLLLFIYNLYIAYSSRRKPTTTTHHAFSFLLFLVAVLLAPSKTQAVGDLVEDIDVVVCTTEGLLAGTKSVDGDVSQRVNTLSVISADGAVDNESFGSVLGVDVVVVVLELDGGLAGTILVDLVVLAVVRGGSNTTGDGVTGLPVGGEVGAGAVVETLGLLGVLGLAGLGVGADGTTLGTVVLLLGEVLGVGRTPDTIVVSYLMPQVWYGGNLLKTVSVISRDDDKSLIENVELLELLNSSTDSVVKLEKITQSTVVVKGVHLLVDRGSLRHEEETLVLATGAEDIDGLEGHVLKTGQVLSITLTTGGVVAEVLEVVCVDIAVEPNGQVALAEDTESTLALVGLEKRCLVVGDSVALLLELLVVVLALVRALGEEVLGTATEENIGALVLGPAVVAVAVESLVDERTVKASGTGVASESNRSSIGKVGGRNSTPSTTLVQLEH